METPPPEIPNPNEAKQEKRVSRLLPGAEARLIKAPPASLSPAKLTWRELKKNKLAIAGAVTLILLYTIALFGQFIAPYNPIEQSPGGQQKTFHPPMKLRWRTAEGAWHLRPFVYGTVAQWSEDRQLTYLPDPNELYQIQFFVQGPKYKFLGVIPSRLHLFGVDKGYVYLLGTDEQSRDYFSRLIYGAQISLTVGLIAIAISFSLGLLVGGISGYFGGRTDDVIMRLCEVLMSVPDFYLLLALAAAMPVDINSAIVYLLIISILSMVGWAGMARVVRGMVLSVREREYVEAAHALGVGDLKIILRHILPSTFTYAIVAATMSVPGYILGEAGLSFLGVGIREPMASWGNMLSAAQDLNTFSSHPWVLAPAVMIFITTLAYNFLGDGLRDALDPKTRN
jgi:peptide/nickel transport system permease protein